MINVGLTQARPNNYKIDYNYNSYHVAWVKSVTVNPIVTL